MDRRKRSRPDDERERRAPDAPPAQAHPLLELQRGAGNRAVSSLLARAPDTKEKEAAPPTSRATLPGIGTIPLLAASRGGSRQVRRDEEDTSGKLDLSSKLGEHSALLSKAMLDGRPMDVEVVLGRLRLQLKGAIVSHYSVSGDAEGSIEQWSLDFRSIEQSVTGTE